MASKKKRGRPKGSKNKKSIIASGGRGKTSWSITTLGPKRKKRMTSDQEKVELYRKAIKEGKIKPLRYCVIDYKTMSPQEINRIMDEAESPRFLWGDEYKRSIEKR